jgi:hypothetical protein
MPMQHVDHPAVHRPMSLLLQALKQIERKAPVNLAVEPPANGQAGASSPPVEEAPTADAASPHARSRDPARPGLTSPAANGNGDLPGSDTISLIRQYEPSETATEIALAGPAHLVPLLTTSARAEPRSATHGERRRRRFADDVLKLLPHDGPAVIGLAPVEGVEVWPVLRELCRGLAAQGDGDVLAVGQTNPAAHESPGTVRFSDLVAGRGEWPSAVSRDDADGFFTLQRGDEGVIAASSGRALLRLWQELSQQFAYIVIDAGLTDPAAATSLVASCDGTFAVVRLDRTNRREVERLITRIRSIGGRACGCLVVE